MKKDISRKIDENNKMINLSNDLLRNIDIKIKNIKDENIKNKYLNIKRMLNNINNLSGLQNIVLNSDTFNEKSREDILNHLDELNKNNREFYMNFFKNNLNKNVINLYLKNENNNEIKNNMLLCMILNINVENCIEQISYFEDKSEKDITKMEILNTIMNYIVENNNMVIDKLCFELDDTEDEFEVDDLYDDLDYITYVSDYLIDLINNNYDKIQNILNEIDKDDKRYDKLFEIETKVLNLYLYLKIKELIFIKNKDFSIEELTNYINKLFEFNKIDYKFMIDEITGNGFLKDFKL